MFNLFVSLLFAYILGSLPFSIYLVDFYNLIDPRKYGSRNIGATNIGRQNKILGLVVFLFDIFKVIFSLFLASFLIAPENFIWIWLFVILGQTRSIFLDFTGGKGVSCFISGVLCLYPDWFIYMLIPCLFICFLTKRIWTGSISAVLLFSIFSLSLPFFYASVNVFIAIWIVYLHRKNIKDDFWLLFFG